MASRSIATAVLLISLNLMFFTMVSSTYCPPPPPKKPHTPSKPHHPSPSPSKGKCPRDALKLNVCADLLNGLVHIALPEKSKCCTLLGGLVDLDAAVCLCTAIKANVLGINLNLPIDLSLVLNPCDKKLPEGFKCA